MGIEYTDAFDNTNTLFYSFRYYDCVGSRVGKEIILVLYIMKIQIEKVYINWEKKDGTKFVDKFGKPYPKITVKSVDGEYYSCLDFSGQTKDWKDGQTIDVEVEEKDGFKNIVLPKKENIMMDRIAAFEERLEKLESIVGKGVKEEISKNVDDLPF